MQREAVLYTRVGDRVRCDACARKCLIGEGKIGFCGVRSVSQGKLYLNVYAKVAAAHIDPIEKKPWCTLIQGPEFCRSPRLDAIGCVCIARTSILARGELWMGQTSHLMT